MQEFAFLFTSLGLRKLKSDDTSNIRIDTKYGNFIIRNIDIDLNIVSPAFERLDMNELVNHISNSLNMNHQVMFIDVGAGFGNQTVAIGNLFRSFSRNISILSFEPEPESFALLKKNIRLNSIKNARAFPVALSDRKSIQNFFYLESMKQIVSFPTPHKIKIRTTTLDTFMKHMKKSKNTDIYMKFDIEGHEVKALKGSKRIISFYKNVTILIEDSVGIKAPELIRYLEDNGTFLMKKTSYNSFWKLHS